LTWGSSVYAKVVAYNNYGDSPISAVGNGAILITHPDAPISLSEKYLLRSATSLGLTWTAGASNGGAAIFDYTVSYD